MLVWWPTGGLLWSLLVCGLLGVNAARAQGVSLELGKKVVALNEAYTVAVTIKNETLKNYAGFPEIDGFSKRGVSSSSSTNIVNNQVSSTQRIVQNYQAAREGVYRVRPFEMKVNGQTLRSEGGTVTVIAARQAQAVPTDPFGSSPFEEFFGGPAERNEFVDVRDNAFFALTTDKKSVYVGEGFTATLAFYLPDDNRAEMDFYEVGTQLVDILKKIKPINCWEENFGIDEIQELPVSIKGHEYREFKIFQATFYPLNNQPIVFPSVGLKMIKYKVAKQPGFFGRDRQQDFKVFVSEPVTVVPRPLPPHPLREQVSVGTFRLQEDIETHTPTTGQGVAYRMMVVGEGNLAAVRPPDLPASPAFDFYPPNVKQDITRAGGRVTGKKLFSYQLLAKEPGTFPLKDYFRWIYFDPRRAVYDTLRSQITMRVSGPRVASRSEADLGPLYNAIDREDNTLRSLRASDWVRTVANLLILAMVVGTAVAVLRKR